MRQGSETQRLCSKQFQSTHPLRGATKAKHGQQDSCHISIHAPLAGCDLCRRFNASCIGYFNPRTPCGVRHEPGTDACRADGISIHAPLAGCDLDNQRANGQAKISIHAPLAGCDIRLRTGSRLAANFNPRTPCGVRQEHKPPNTFAAQFQSTHPLRGATHSVRAVSHHALISIHAPLAGCDLCRRFNASCIGYFNPRTPCGVRLARPAAMTGCAGFQSTHPLRGATSSSTRMRGTGTFQSTHPLRGATIPPSETVVRMAISIHAPLAGCDAARAPTSFRSSHFNPRTPCGVRPGQPCAKLDLQGFQSTHPLRGATQTHAVVDLVQIFQSTHPLRGATRVPIVFRSHRPISIHAPLAGCDTHRGCGFCER